MAKTYTRLFWHQELLTAGETVGPPVPHGKVWVIRDAIFWNPADVPPQYPGQIIIQTLAGQIVCGIAVADACYGRLYNQNDLRQLVYQDEFLAAFTIMDGWCLSLSGFEFDAS